MGLTPEAREVAEELEPAIVADIAFFTPSDKRLLPDHEAFLIVIGALTSAFASGFAQGLIQPVTDLGKQAAGRIREWMNGFFNPNASRQSKDKLVMEVEQVLSVSVTTVLEGVHRGGADLEDRLDAAEGAVEEALKLHGIPTHKITRLKKVVRRTITTRAQRTLP